jgi:carbonic anhydrase/acetyltransferase-like protein (isoleucine patch superfamily)
VQLLFSLIAVVDRFSQKRYMKLLVWLLRKRGVRVSSEALWISPKAFFDFGEPGSISIGRRSVVSHFVQVLTHDYSLDRVAESRGITDLTTEGLRRAPVRIGDYCFIGIGAILLAGVSIGDRSIVGAHAVVTKDVPPDSVVAGNPARLVSTTDRFMERRWEEYSQQSRRR